jgi:hypothetical protein
MHSCGYDQVEQIGGRGGAARAAWVAADEGELRRARTNSIEFVRFSLKLEFLVLEGDSGPEFVFGN